MYFCRSIFFLLYIYSKLHFYKKKKKKKKKHFVSIDNSRSISNFNFNFFDNFENISINSNSKLN